MFNHRFPRQHDNIDLRVLIGVGLFVLGLLGFFKFASEVIEGDTLSADRAILLMLRSPNNLSQPIGPPWLTEAMRDITSLGSGTVLTLVTVIALGCLIASSRYAGSCRFLFVVLLAQLANYGLKHFYGRPRPEIVPHLVEVNSKSFPSGHSTMSAVVYLAVAALLSSIITNRRLKIFVVLIAIFLSFIVGISRVYLGVHYPSDVIAGWAFGFVWAIGLRAHPKTC